MNDNNSSRVSSDQTSDRIVTCIRLYIRSLVTNNWGVESQHDDSEM